jgi:hypothetical protein
MAHAILATWESKIGTITVQGHSRQIIHEALICKTTREKWLKQESTCFASKALSSHPSSTQKNKNRMKIKCQTTANAEDSAMNKTILMSSLIEPESLPDSSKEW